MNSDKRKVIFIDAKNQQVSLQTMDFPDIQKAIEGYCEDIGALADGHHLYANEDGLMRNFPYGFSYDRKVKLKGNGVIVRVDNEGDSIDVTLQALSVFGKIEFTPTVEGPRAY